jgi:hypothetical protein
MSRHEGLYRAYKLKYEKECHQVEQLQKLLNEREIVIAMLNGEKYQEQTKATRYQLLVVKFIESIGLRNEIL